MAFVLNSILILFFFEPYFFKGVLVSVFIARYIHVSREHNDNAIKASVWYTYENRRPVLYAFIVFISLLSVMFETQPRSLPLRNPKMAEFHTKKTRLPDIIVARVKTKRVMMKRSKKFGSTFGFIM